MQITNLALPGTQENALDKPLGIFKTNKKQIFIPCNIWYKGISLDLSPEHKRFGTSTKVVGTSARALWHWCRGEMLHDLLALVLTSPGAKDTGAKQLGASLELVLTADLSDCAGANTNLKNFPMFGMASVLKSKFGSRAGAKKVLSLHGAILLPSPNCKGGTT